MPKKQTQQTGKRVLRLKIELTNSKPLIWRSILVPETYSFFDLHVAIQDAMGWFGCHLHQFFNKSPYTKDYVRINVPHPEDNMFDDIKPLDERKTKLSDFLKKETDAVWYEYDFGDGWIHKITLEKTLLWTENMVLPSILAGKNRCPYEDSGALWGYYEKMEILKNKEYPEYQDILWWVAEQAGYEPDDLDDSVLAELSDMTHFDIKKIQWSNPREELRIYEEMTSL